MAYPQVVAWPDSSQIKMVQTQHLPHSKTYQVIVEFPTQAAAQEFVNDVAAEGARRAEETSDGTEYAGRIVAPTHTVESDESLRLVGPNNTPVDTKDMPVAETVPPNPVKEVNDEPVL